MSIPCPIEMQKPGAWRTEAKTIPDLAKVVVAMLNFDMVGDGSSRGKIPEADKPDLLRCVFSSVEPENQDELATELVKDGTSQKLVDEVHPTSGSFFRSHWPWLAAGGLGLVVIVMVAKD